MADLPAGWRIALVKALRLRSHVKVGTLGIVRRSSSCSGLVEVQFNGRLVPYLLRTKQRPRVAPRRETT